MSKHKLKNQNIKQGIKNSLFLLIGLLAYLVNFQTNFAAEPSSTNYKIESYSFAGGGIIGGSSTNYKLNGALGEIDSSSLSSTNYKVGNGLSFLQTVNVPPAPTFTNPSNYYNKLFLTLSTGNNPSDTKFAIAISPDGFTTTYYVQANDTLGSSPVWQTNTVWGSSGFNIIGLTNGTTYSVKVSAMQGNFTQSAFGPIATAATVNSQFSFSVTPSAVNIGTLTPGNLTTAATTISVNLATNGVTGGTVYIYDTNSGLKSSNTGYTINAVTSDLSSTSEGYGLQASSPTQSSGGPMEVLSPFSATGSNVALVNTSKSPIFDSSSSPVTGGTGTITIKAKAGSTAKAATDYSDTIYIIAAATF